MSGYEERKRDELDLLSLTCGSEEELISQRSEAAVC